MSSRTTSLRAGWMTAQPRPGAMLLPLRRQVKDCPWLCFHRSLRAAVNDCLWQHSLTSYDCVHRGGFSGGWSEPANRESFSEVCPGPPHRHRTTQQTCVCRVLLMLTLAAGWQTKQCSSGWNSSLAL